MRSTEGNFSATIEQRLRRNLEEKKLNSDRERNSPNIKTEPELAVSHKNVQIENT